MIAANRSETSVVEPVLYVAFELGKKSWTLAATSGFGQAPMLRMVRAGDFEGVTRVLRIARQAFGLPPGAVVLSCYEAGRDGFWIHRALEAQGVRNRVVDSSSIEVKRRARRTKTDRLDARKLVMMLVRVCSGEQHVWSEVHVPSAAVEAARHGSRERTTLTKERTRLTNQITSWLATWGCEVSRRTRQRATWWTTVRTWDGAALPTELQARIARTTARLTLLTEQIATLEGQQAAATRTAAADSARGRLVRLKGVAATSSAILLEEGLEWRQFQNRRQVGGLLGFAPTHYDSGDTARDQGISRAGNTRLQAVMMQVAWGWVQFQPDSVLTRWYRDRFGQGKRARKIGIVALARKLLIALWRWATAGVLPAGAVLKTA